MAPLLLLVAVVGCSSPALTPGSAPRAPETADAADLEEISLEISALM